MIRHFAKYQVVIIVWLSFFFSPVFAEGIAFPSDAGFVNVRSFGAKADWVSDDTAAINAAIAASGQDMGKTFWQDKIVYFPNGTYRISQPLQKLYTNGNYASGMILIGQSRAQTILKLADHVEGYGDARAPRAMIFTSSKRLDGNGGNYRSLGEGNDAYMNFIENMTLDVGRGNPGAIGVDYLANNIGAIRHVTLRAPKGSGAVGISMTRQWPGPALLQDVRIEGFTVGMDIDQTEYSLTFDHIALINQGEIGIRNRHNILAMHDIHIHNAPVAMANLEQDGLIVLMGGVIECSAPFSCRNAFENTGYITLSDLAVLGYPKPAIQGLLPMVWDLPEKEAPRPYKEPVKNWVKVDYQGGDATFAIRRAFASGAATIYFPHGVYPISENLIIPPAVRRIIGMTSTITAYKKRHKKRFLREKGMFIAQNDHYPLSIERLAFDHSNLGRQVAVEALGREALVLHDIVGAGVQTLKRPVKGGEVFLEDTCCGTLDIAGRNGVWAKQLNTEGAGVRIINHASPLWVLGLKSEGQCTILDNENGAKTQIAGGLLYPVTPFRDANLPAFVNHNSQIALSYAEEAFNSAAAYRIHLVSDHHTITASMLPERHVGRVVPRLFGE